MPSISQSQPFSSSGEDAITQNISVSSEKTPSRDACLSEFLEYYDIDRTVRSIEDGDYKAIALQFPDELLHDSVPVYQELSKRLGSERKAYVLADTSYGSCCVDEVTASHVDADVLVHYGHACLSQTSRLPVIYVFGKKQLDIEECADKLAAYLTLHEMELDGIGVIELRSSVWYSHLMSSVSDLLQQKAGTDARVLYSPLPTVVTPAKSTTLAVEAPTDSTLLEVSANDVTGDSDGRKLIAWVGEESTTLTKLLMTSSGLPVISYSPQAHTVQAQSHVSNKLLMRRYAILQKARDADVFGILLGTLGVASYMHVISHIRTILKKAHKKSYTVSVGKINPAKLANFLEIECWVWVSCSESMVDSKEYLRPIITPYELEIALQPEPQWTGKYVLDFGELLAKTSLEESGRSGEGEDAVDEERPIFSLVSGSYRHAKRYGELANVEVPSDEQTKQKSTALARISPEKSLSKMSDSAAAQFLQGRTYQGLDPRLGQDAPSVLEQGRSGIARGYGDDHRGS